MSTAHRHYCERCASVHESIDCPPLAQHTPGPWRAFNKDGKHVQADEWSTDCEGASTSTHAPIKAGTQVVALVVASSRRWPDLRDIAPDCRLIAAAPDLLAALQPFVTHNSSDETITITVRTADMTRARAAIAKATGSAA